MVSSHSPQADDAGGGLFRAADDIRQQLAVLTMERRDQVCTIIHGDMGFVRDSSAQVFIIRAIIFALDCKDRDFVLGHQGSSHIILRGKRVRSGKHKIRTASLQSPHEVGCLGGHVHARRHANALERALFAETLLDRG